MNNSVKYINASKWPSLIIGNKEFFSPNKNILEQIRINPDKEFWSTTYTEFACIIIDKNNHIAYCVRDHFGLEPFFYHLSDNRFIFASNLPDIINNLGYTPKHNHSQIMLMLLAIYASKIYYSDETNYKDIYRVEPGCRLTIKNQQIIKSKYWQLDQSAEPIIYAKKSDYLEHFIELLHEGIKLQLDGAINIAAEFSGGFDSSTVITALQQLGINADLFMHLNPNNNEEGIGDSDYANAIIKCYDQNKIHYINATNFDFIKIAKKSSQLFAGTPFYTFPIFANNIHAAVINNRNKILLSGFGGDECVSSHASINIYLRQCFKDGDFKYAWHELNAHYFTNNQALPSIIHRLLTILKSTSPTLIDQLRRLKALPKIIQAKLNHIEFPPFQAQSLSIREQELRLLQGDLSQHVRLRIEESAIVAKHMGFRYKYPLLYPKLIEFCYRLPNSLKRHNGQNRIMVQNYLKQSFPDVFYYKKASARGGIMPATFHKFEQEYMTGQYKDEFRDLPYQIEASWIESNYKKDALLFQLLYKSALYTMKIFEH